MDFMYVFQKMTELFLIIIIEYISCKTGIFDRTMREKVTKLVLDITLPAMVLASVMMQEELPGTGQILQLLLVAALSYVLLLVVALLAPKILGIPLEEQGIYRFMLTFGNVGFIGYPVTQAIFGDGAVFYTCVFNLPFNFLVFSIGVLFLQQSGDSSIKNKITYKTFLTPCLITAIIAIVMALLHLKTPAIIGETCDAVAGITTPAALMIIGSSLAELPFKDMLGNVRIYLFALCRLIGLPLLTYFIFRLFIQDELLLGVSVIMAAMPVATNGTMLCVKCGADEKIMAQGTFITTLLSVFTIPVIAMLVQ